jgi:hypothetical protein
MQGKPPVITVCHFQFRLLQSLIIYRLPIPLLYIFELRGAQLNEDKVMVYLFPTDLRSFYFKNLKAEVIFEVCLLPSIVHSLYLVCLTIVL